MTGRPRGSPRRSWFGARRLALCALALAVAAGFLRECTALPLLADRSVSTASSNTRRAMLPAKRERLRAGEDAPRDAAVEGRNND